MAGLLRDNHAREVLQSTVREWASSDCQPHPCGLSVWSYVCKVSQVAEPELPEHQSLKAIKTLLRKEGGLEQYARGLMLSLGWEEVDDVLPGDVAVAKMPGMGLTCVICIGRLFMAKGNGFVLMRPADHVAAWRFTQCLKPSPPHLLPQLAQPELPQQY